MCHIKRHNTIITVSEDKRVHKRARTNIYSINFRAQVRGFGILNISNTKTHPARQRVVHAGAYQVDNTGLMTMRKRQQKLFHDELHNWRIQSARSVQWHAMGEHAIQISHAAFKRDAQLPSR